MAGQERYSINIDRAGYVLTERWGPFGMTAMRPGSKAMTGRSSTGLWSGSHLCGLCDLLTADIANAWIPLAQRVVDINVRGLDEVDVSRQLADMGMMNTIDGLIPGRYEVVVSKRGLPKPQWFN